MTAPTLSYITEVPSEAEIAAELREQGIFVCPVCIGPPHADGGCRNCERDADPAWAAAWGAYCDAINRAEDCEAAGLPYPDAEQDRRDEETQRRFELAQTLAEQDARTSANACARCGREERGHGWGGWLADSAAGIPVGRWDKHSYSTPTDRCRLLRIKARRDAADARLYRAVARRFNAIGGPA